MVALPRNDPYYEDKENYANVNPLWLANLVDTYNQAMTDIEGALVSIDARLTAGGL